MGQCQVLPHGKYMPLLTPVDSSPCLYLCGFAQQKSFQVLENDVLGLRL